MNPAFHESWSGWRFWVDRGGTFTDIVARTPDGRIVAHKLLSEVPGRARDAIVQGVRDVLGLADDAPLDAGAIDELRVGTTVATNALLERLGAETVLVITAGFEDLPVIGSQERPELFALAIERPPPLHARVVGAVERLSADGEVLRPLDVDALEAALRTARAEGCQACAIALLHGWRHPAHEQAAAEVAARVGFTQVSVSHRSDPQQRLVPRCDTTVADAYLSPVLHRYVARLAAQLPGVPLRFMQSSGGLTDAALLDGKDAVLSGPAGGVVATVAVGRAHGCEAVIGFDMGGTSTDVCHWSGQDERSTLARVAGVRLRTPMLQIHTVAAGGGSIVAVDGARLTVGPASAGADPGPACYGRGGPATITDANLLLGRLLPTRFPQVFGPQGNAALDRAASERAFAALAAQLGRDDPLEIARGAVRIADEAMAQAIRQISVQRGHDVRQYALCAFGGAGGQHACGVATLLGMRRILLHPLAGVQSAWGIGLAPLQRLATVPVDAPLDAQDLAATLDDARREQQRILGDALRRQAGAHATPSFVCELRLRYAGSDSHLELPVGGPLSTPMLKGLVARFHDAHRLRYGFARPEVAIIADALRIEARCAAEGLTPVPAPPVGVPPPAPLTRARLWSGAAQADTPVHERSGLAAGMQIAGPALIVDATATLVVDAGWTLHCAADGTLILEHGTHAERPQPRTQQADTAPDPITLELFHRLFMAIAERMGTTLQQTSQSVNIRERLDFSCAVFDAEGRLVANAPHMPVHLGSMGDSVTAIRRRHGDALRAGDSFAINAPFDGGTHLPDITVVSPVFLTETDERPSFWVASRGHHADIGGISPGSMPPDSRCIDDEGVLFDGLRIAADGRMHDEAVRAVLTGGPHPARRPAQNLADLRAQVAANHCGVEALREACLRHGAAQVAAYAGFVLDDAESAVRRALGTLHDGAFAVDMDNGAHIAVRVRIDHLTRSAEIDFTGTSAQREDNFNAPTPVCKAAVLYVFRCLIDRDIPLNDGCLRPLRLVIPPDSLLAPRHPAAVVAGNVETSQCIVDALFGALGRMAAAQGTMNNLTFGNERLQYYETICGGSGAGEGFDGCDAVQTHMTNSRLTDPEVLESRFPVRVERFAIRRGSGGGGQFRGGDGVLRALTMLEPMRAALLANRRRTAPFGLAGGGAGLPARDRVLRADGRSEPLPSDGHVWLAAGDGLIIETPGGGGYGAPP